MTTPNASALPDQTVTDDGIVNMTIEECLLFADEWSRGMTLSASTRGWRVVCMLLAAEVRKLRAQAQAQPQVQPDQGDYVLATKYSDGDQSAKR